MRWKLIAPIVAIGVVLCVLAHEMIVRSATNQVESLSKRDAETMAAYVSALRRYYTANVVADAQHAQLRVGHEHDGDPTTIPLPATMVHELNALMRRSTNDAAVRLYSPYPFPWRTDGGLRSPIDEEEWRVLSQDPSRVLVRTVSENGQPVMRYATADVMNVQACVDCHNSHPNSPRTGWKLGDTRGVLAVSVPMGASIIGAREDAMRATALVVAITFVLVILTLYLARRALFVPLEEIAGVAQKVAAGDLNVTIQHRSNDELGDVAESLRSATRYLRGLGDAVEQLGRGTLEGELAPASDADVVSRNLNVAQAELKRRAGEILKRNADMRLVLDHVNQGLVTVALDGMMAKERSQVLERWFGNAAGDVTLWDYLQGHDPVFAGWLKLGWEGLKDGFLPVEVVLDQLPKRLAVAGRTLSLEYQPILGSSEVPETVLVVISDISAQLEAEKTEARQREMMAVFQRLLHDRSGTIEFLEECQTIVDGIRQRNESSQVELARMLHTLKGNCAIFGVMSISTLCHEVEERLKEVGALSDEDRAIVGQAWSSFSERTATFLVGQQTSQEGKPIVIDRAEYNHLLDQLVKGAPRSELARELIVWRHDLVRPRLERLGEQARQVARRLDKEVEVVIEEQGVRVPGDKLRSLWMALVHPIRNAIDHGLETRGERAASGKPTCGKLTLRARASDGSFVLEICDDGRGVDWDAVAARAAKLGRPATTAQDLTAALFSGGLSTKQEASELSGRGIGMSAVYTEVQELGGMIEVVSTRGRGTVIRIAIPETALDYRAASALIGSVRMSRTSFPISAV